MAADDAVCLSATDTRGDRGGDLGDIGGEFTGEDAASSSLNANGTPDAVCVVGFIEVRGEVRGDRRGEAGGDDMERSDGVTLELGERGDLGGDGAGDIAGDLAGEAAGALDLAGDLATGDLATECVVGRVPDDDDARPLAYCVCRSTRETLRLGVVLAPHAGLGVVLGLGAGAGSYGERAPEDEGGGGVVLSSALRLAGDAGAPWNRDAPVPTVPLAGAGRGAEPGGGFAFARALRVFRPSEDIPNVDDVGILAPPTARRLSSVCASPRLLQQFQSKRLKTEAREKVARPALVSRPGTMSTSCTFATPTRLAAPGLGTSRPRRPQVSSAAASSSSSAATTAWLALERCTRGTEKGLRCDETQRATIEEAIAGLEALNPSVAPSDSEALEGVWEVTYSNAPPPSNGSLGPFKGTAYQDIDLAEGTYVNRLRAGKDDWLGARLRADWTRVDDTIWLVTFRDVTVSVLGFDLFTKSFTDTTRVWEHTYVDDDYRVVRAARTMEGLRREGARGRTAVAGDDDDCVFTMKRV